MGQGMRIFQRLVQISVLALWPSLAFSDTTSDSLSIHPGAMALTQSPPEIKSLSKICERQFGSTSASFWGLSNKATLWVSSRNPITDLARVITLRVVFNPMPTARPGPDATLTWGYIFDRNQDGKIDYLVFLEGPRPVAPDEFPENFPKDNKFSPDQLGLVLDRIHLVFFHFADDNFDGIVDTIVAPLTHAEYPLWVHNYGVLRSSKFDGNIDDEWTFRQRVNEKAGRVPVREGRYIMQRADKALQGSEWLEAGTKLLEYINKAAMQCGLGAGSVSAKPD